jgi:hypothetical protein
LFVRDRRAGRRDANGDPLPSSEERGTLSTDD